VTVGSETLYRGNFTGETLLAKMQAVKTALGGKFRIGTADSWNKYADGTADAVIKGNPDLLYVLLTFHVLCVFVLSNTDQDLSMLSAFGKAHQLPMLATLTLMTSSKPTSTSMPSPETQTLNFGPVRLAGQLVSISIPLEHY
jgi:hypothetical protein